MRTYVLLFLIGVFAFFLKGLMGTGPTTALVSLGVLVIAAKQTIVLASLLNVVGGFAMLRVDPVPLPKNYWIPIAVFMTIGSVAGAWALKEIPSREFELLLGIVFLATAIYFLLRSPRARETSAVVTDEASTGDLIVGLFGGFCGGFVGVNAPVLVPYFARFLDKQHLRRLLVIIFIPAAVAQTATFAYNGLLTLQVIIWGAVLTPAMAIGIYAGNKAFGLVSENMFRKLLGVLLIFISVKIILRG